MLMASDGHHNGLTVNIQALESREYRLQGRTWEFEKDDKSYKTLKVYQV